MSSTVPPTVALLRASYGAVSALESFVEEKSVQLEESVNDLADVDGILMVGPHGASSCLGLLPVLTHRPTIVFVEDCDVASALEAGATEVLSLEATAAEIARAIRIAPDRFARTKRLTTRVDDLRAAIAGLPIGVAVIENDHIVYMNKALEELWRGPSILGEPIVQLFHPADHLIWNSSERPAELRLNPNSGEETTVEVSDHSTLSTKEGTVGLLTFRDVTEARALAARLHKAERISSLRSIALEIAHEVNNPLAIFSQDLPELSSMLDAFDGEDVPVVREIMEEMTIASDRIAAAVVRLRDAADTVVSSDFGTVFDAARASARMASSSQFDFENLSLDLQAAHLAIDPATSTPLIRAALSFASSHANFVSVQCAAKESEVDVYLTLTEPSLIVANGELDGALTPARMSALASPVADEFSIELSIAKRANAHVLLSTLDDSVVLTLRLPLLVCSTVETQLGIPQTPFV